MAGRPLAEEDEVLANGLEAELRVERRHAQHLGGAVPRLLGDGVQHVNRQIAVDLLRLLQDRYEGVIVPGERLEHRRQLGQVALLATLAHVFSPKLSKGNIPLLRFARGN